MKKFCYRLCSPEKQLFSVIIKLCINKCDSKDQSLKTTAGSRVKMLHKLQRHQNPDSEPWQVHTWRDGIAEYTRFVEANNISWGQRDINLVEPFMGGKIFNQWVPMRLKQFNYIKVFLIWYLYVETIRLYNSSAVMNCILLCCMKPWFTQISSSKKFRSKTSKFYVGFFFFLVWMI